MCASPLCTPARCSILTGLPPHTTGVEANYRPGEPGYSVSPLTRLLADYLKPHDYICDYVGKWHLPTGSDRRGFSDFVRRLTAWDTDAEADDDAVRFGRQLGLELGDSYAKYLAPAGAVDPTGGRHTRLPLAFHPSTQMALEAASRLRQLAQGERPFLLTYSCIEPHPLGMTYHIAPAPFDRMYRPEDMCLPATCRDPNAPRIVRNRNFYGLKSTDGYSDGELREMIAGYYGAVSYVDHLFGILLEPLIATGRLDDTLIIFTSDHGEMLGDHRMLKKGPVMFEEMIRIPFLVKAPQGETSTQIPELVSHLDIVPTVLDYCDIATPPELTGVSLRPLLEGSKKAVRNGLTIEYHSCVWGEPQMPLRAWRTSEWKYVECGAGDHELYHLTEDPGETVNLAKVASAQEKLNELKKELYTDMMRTQDNWPQVAEPRNRIEMAAGAWDRLP